MSEDRESLPARVKESEYFPFPGQPGYRNRPGRTGLDYVDNVYEYYYEIGLFIRYLFTGRLRTSSPILLAVMAIIAVLCLLPFVATIILHPNSREWTMGLILFFPLNVLGLGLLFNLVLNLIPKNKGNPD